jgi:hypothetical protein
MEIASEHVAFADILQIRSARRFPSAYATVFILNQISDKLKGTPTRFALMTTPQRIVSFFLPSARPGLRVIEGTQLLAHILHPEIFPWIGPQTRTSV